VVDPCGESLKEQCSCRKNKRLIMIEDLKPALELARNLPSEELPRFLGALRECEATALARLTSPVPVDTTDELLTIEQAAQRLNVSTNYLYRHHARFGFSRRIGRALRFSAAGLQKYIAARR
jgi:excisionase family DNA binding protein